MAMKSGDNKYHFNFCKFVCWVVLFHAFLPHFSFANDTDGPSPLIQKTDPGKAKRARELWEKGNVLADKGFMDRAHEYWKIALEIDPNLAKGEESSNPASDMDVSELTSTYVTNDHQKLERLGKLLTDAQEAYRQMGYERALQLLDKAEAISPKEPPVENLREKIELDYFKPVPGSPYNRLVKGNLDAAVQHFRKGEYDSASRSIEQAYKIDSDDPRIKELKRLIEKKSRELFLDGVLERAKGQWKAGKKDLALESLSQLLQEHPDYQPAIELQAQIKSGGGTNDSAQIMNIIGRAMREEKKDHYFEAEKDYERALRLDPDNVEAHKGLERTIAFVEPLAAKVKELERAIQGRQKKRAETFLAQIEAISPDDQRLELWKSKISELGGNAISPEDLAKADAAYNMGLESYRNGHLEDAEKFWLQALDLDPGHPQAKSNLDRLLAEHSELKQQPR